MRKARWLASWRNSMTKPVFYHCISRVVDRRFVLGSVEKERFRTLMRMYEKFSGCRVTAYCLMDNHFHLLLEVPPMAEGGISDEELLKRLGAIYSEAFVADVATQLADARMQVAQGLAIEEAVVKPIHERFTYRMHHLGEFMKGVLQRYTQWHNRNRSRTGRLWEDRFKSVIVEDGLAARTIAAYIDLNPVRARLVKDPARYRWSSYGEANGAGAMGNGKTARAGLVRALLAHRGCSADAGMWREIEEGYRRLLMAGAAEKTQAGQSEALNSQQRYGVAAVEAERDKERACDFTIGKILRCRLRYLTDGAVIGSKAFVNEAFLESRARFGQNRRDGARRLRGVASAAAEWLWSFRDLRKGIAS